MRTCKVRLGQVPVAVSCGRLAPAQAVGRMALATSGADPGDRLDHQVDVLQPGPVVTDRGAQAASISSRVRLARKALGDDGERQEFISAVHGLGFRFVAPVTEEAPAAVAGARLAARGGAWAALDRGPPLEAIGLEAERAMLANAVSHDVIQALSRLRLLAVIARGSSFRFRSVVPDVAEMGAALGARYVLSGLIEADGAHLSPGCYAPCMLICSGGSTPSGIGHT